MSEKLSALFMRNNLELGPEECNIILAETSVAQLPLFGGSGWRKIRYVCGFGRASVVGQLREGLYVSHDGSWLIVYGSVQWLRSALDRCGKNLVFLRIENQLLASVDVSSMEQLRYLRIGKNTNDSPSVMTLRGLEHLKNLEQLFLGGTFTFSNLDLSRMRGLQGLSLWCNATLEAVTGLSALHSLKNLHIYDVIKVRELDLSGLENLDYLLLESLPSFSRFPELGQVHSLRYLCVCGTAAEVSSVDLSGMRSLEAVDLSHNASLEEIRGLEDLDRLTYLNISCTAVRRIPEGLRGKPLETLGLSELELEELPGWLPELGMAFSRKWYGNGILLWKTRARDVDMSIFDQPREMILRWFESRKRGDDTRLNEIKVVFLGDGDAGKSHTIARLMNDGGDPVDYTDKSTPGIVIKNKNYFMDGRNIRVHYWDFGGQEILHSMHRIFLTERTLYVVLVNARDETQDNRARYWLHNIQSFANNAPVILVLNKIDQNPKAKFNEPDLRGKYPNLKQVVSMSALEFDQTRFNREFTDVLLTQIMETGYPDVKWPIPWTKVKGELETMKTNYIRGEQYKEICRRCSVDRHEKDLLHWFNDLGVSYYCCDDYRLEDYMILRPDWITNALYIILFNDCPGAKNGLIPHRAISRLLSENPEHPEQIRRVLPGVWYTWNEISFVLEVFHNAGLSFGAGTDHEFIPMLCDPTSSPVARQYEEEEGTLEFRMEFDYLPNNLLHQLMVDRKEELRMDHVWRTGALFEQKETGLSAVVTIDGDVLRFFVQSGDPMHRPNTYLTMLKANVDRIWQKMGLKEPKNWLIYKYHGKKAVFRYERILKLHTKGRETEYCEELDQDFPIEDILNQSAPAAEKDQKALLDALILACQHLQGHRKYWSWNEDERNTAVRNSLRDKGYIVNDQTLQGRSGTGHGTGELDMDIRIQPNEPWTICEALIVEGYSKKWNEHLDKLLNNYNPYSLPVLYLLTYVDCDQKKFTEKWAEYQAHIRRDPPAGFDLVPGSVRTDLFDAYGSTRVARCSYQKGGYTPTVYHIFARIGE